MSVRLASRGQKALIHIAKKELGLSESLYRATLRHVCGKESAAELTGPEAKRLIDFFEKMGFSPRKKEKKRFYRDFSNLPEDRDPWASPGQLKLIYKLWARISRAKDKQVALRRFVFRLAKVSDPTFLTFRQAGIVIEALKKMDARENGSGPKVEGGR